MLENDKNIVLETEAAFALAVVLLNFLILAAAAGLVWSLQLLLSANGRLSAALGEILWR